MSVSLDQTWRRPAAASFLCALLSSCGTPADHPPGVPSSISFHVQPVYPRSYDIIASGRRNVSAQALEAAWRHKAAQVAAGRKFQVSGIATHATEEIGSIHTGYMRVPTFTQSQSVRGTLRILK